MIAAVIIAVLLGGFFAGESYGRDRARRESLAISDKNFPGRRVEGTQP